jgi:hypothetical protein
MFQTVEVKLSDEKFAAMFEVAYGEVKVKSG